MTNVYVVPGFGGTSLGTSPATADDTWVSYTALALGHIGRLRLAADGVSPGQPDGVPVYPGYLLPGYYGPCLTYLTSQLGSQGYTILPWPYDWRLDARSLGPMLAGRIQADVAPGSSCVIVAHSYGGLVSRIAWQSLAVQGQSGLVRRIITLGTPHWGAYAAVRLWSLDLPQLTQVWLLSLAGAALAASPFPPSWNSVWPPQRLAALSATWPAMYLTLPSLLAPSAAGDAGRSAVYGSGWPAELGIQSARLQDATQVWQPLLASAATQPPDTVMTTVAAHGLPTVVRLQYPWLLGTPAAYLPLDAGDGTVGQADAVLAGTVQYVVTMGHVDLPNRLAGNGSLAEWITAPPPPPGPTPSPAVLSGPLGNILAGPPVGQPLVLQQTVMANC